jgi:Cu(I)/Ag(I) efflux system membrane fusion protein
MKNIIQNIKDNYKLVLGVFIVGLLFGWIFFHSSSEAIVTTQEVEGHNHETENQIWTCSMHPQIKQDKPGLCPICGMDLIPLTTAASSGDDINPNEIVMSEAAAKLASIQTMMVSKGIPKKTVYLQGKIQADERNIAELTARFGGRIEKLYVNFTGQNVSKGEKLATIYSPALVTAQRELLEAVSFKESRPSLYMAAKGKLKLWDLTDEQISAIEEKGEPLLYFDILSPISGTVSNRNVAIGDYVEEGNPLFKVIDLTKVWVLFDAYESDLPWIKLGDKIEFTIQSLPGKTFSSKVTFIDPFINAETRITSIRVEVPNRQLSLKPEMFTTGILNSQIADATNQILIPKSSFLWTGKRAVVYVKVPYRESPTFVYREIVLGAEAGAFYVVAEGLDEGEEIALNGVFKIDAASQLQGLPSMMNPGGGAGSTPHDMSKMDLGNAKDNGSSKGFTLSEALTEHKSIENTNPAFKKQLTQVFEKYLIMKDAFVESDAHKVMTTANDVKASLQKVDMALLKGDAHMIWMEYLVEMEKATNSISKLMDIKKQRVEFSNFNLTFYKSLKTFGLLNDTAYYQYCPMANSDKGAYWFSDSEIIRNPYFGDAMLKCGENRETFK